ncbi:MAG: NAD(P)-binding domain-containing protein [Actinomycetota bacterium]
MSGQPSTPWKDELWDALSVANIPTLLMVLFQLTGDERWLGERYRPSRPVGMSDNDSGGLPDEIQDEIRQAALVAIQGWRAGEAVAVPDPSRDQLLTMLSVAMGATIPVEHGPMLEAEIRPKEAPPKLSAPDGFSAIVIGAGVAGLEAGHMLGEAGIECTILERNSSVGGTWLENKYPGAGVDTPSHLYSYSFFQYDWPDFFASGADVLSYLQRAATDLGLRPKIRLEAEVTSTTYDELNQKWLVTIRKADGSIERQTADIVISAVGIFNPPVTPKIRGLSSFEGRCAHTARWPVDLDLRGQRVAVIGTGASAMQMVPAIADEVAQVTIFQRNPQWIVPFEKFHKPVPPPIRWLMQAVPLYAKWYRARLGWSFNDQLHPTLQVDPEWPHPERSINAQNDRHRQFLTAYLRSELGEREDLIAKTLPTYPPYVKRLLLDNGWFQALTRPNVELVTDPIEEVRADRVITKSGTEHVVDVIALATGFDAYRFLTAYDIHGREGQSLQELWGDDGRAYLGTVVPGFPNFFCLYGPNLQPGAGGSIMFTLERQMHYILDALRQMFERGGGAIEVKQEVSDRYNQVTEKLLNKMIWNHRGTTTYYRNSKERIVLNSPYRNCDWWTMTESAELSEFTVEPRRHAHGEISVGVGPMPAAS